MAEPYTLTLGEAAELIRRGDLSPVDLTRSVLDRIAAVEPRVQAWARTCAERALAEAAWLEKRLQHGQYLGPLHGIPLGMKDIYYTAGLETSAGSAILAGFVPTEDATVVRRLREAGAILLGKTHTTQFAMADPAPTRNPWNLGHTPGGSSSGSAAAVAADMALGAFGTQTAGSILRPAAYCGVVGLKPTYGRVSRHGIVPLAWTLDHAGPLAKTVHDAALLLEAVAGPDPRDPSAAPIPVPAFGGAVAEGPSGLRVGIPDRYFTERVEGAVAEAYQDALKVLEQVGVRLVDLRLPESFEAGVEAGRLIMHVEGAAVHLDWFRQRPHDYRPKLRALIEAGILVPGVSYLRAQQVRRAAIRDMQAAFTTVDALAAPAAPTPAPPGLGSTGDPVFNAPFSTFGFPALAVPMGFAPSGLPVSLQLAGGPFDEVTILRLGGAYEAATGWRTERPPLEEDGPA